MVSRNACGGAGDRFPAKWLDGQRCRAGGWGQGQASGDKWLDGDRRMQASGRIAGAGGYGHGLNG